VSRAVSFHPRLTGPAVYLPAGGTRKNQLHRRGGKNWGRVFFPGLMWKAGNLEAGRHAPAAKGALPQRDAQLAISSAQRAFSFRESHLIRVPGDIWDPNFFLLLRGNNRHAPRNRGAPKPPSNHTKTPMRPPLSPKIRPGKPNPPWGPIQLTTSGPGGLGRLSFLPPGGWGPGPPGKTWGGAGGKTGGERGQRATSCSSNGSLQGPRDRSRKTWGPKPGPPHPGLRVQGAAYNA